MLKGRRKRDMNNGGFCIPSCYTTQRYTNLVHHLLCVLLSGEMDKTQQHGKTDMLATHSPLSQTHCTVGVTCPVLQHSEATYLSQSHSVPPHPLTVPRPPHHLQCPTPSHPPHPLTYVQCPSPSHPLTVPHPPHPSHPVTLPCSPT